MGWPREVIIADLSRMVLDKLGRSDLQPVHLNEDRPGDIGHSQANIDKARALLGFAPKTDIDVGLDRYITWIRDQNIDVDMWKQQEQVQNWQVTEAEGGNGSAGPVPATTKSPALAPQVAPKPLILTGASVPAE